MKNKGTAAILALFLGGLGIHQFYLGNSGRGILYLLFCWTFIPVIISIIDFLILIFTSEGHFHSKYNKSYKIN
jgi:TM2 domain-containing membrane protein YozV